MLHLHVAITWDFIYLNVALQSSYIDWLEDVFIFVYSKPCCFSHIVDFCTVYSNNFCWLQISLQNSENEKLSLMLVVAEQVLQKGQITFGKSVIKVQKPTNASCISSSASVETSLTNVQTDEVKSRTVEIRGHLLKDLSKENISLYFENKKRSGGGTVDSVQILSKDSAIIVFKQAQG